MTLTPRVPQPESSATQDVYDGLRVTHRPAPFWLRLFAYVTDLGITTLAIYLIVVVGMMIGLALFGAAVGTGGIDKKMASKTEILESVFGISGIILLVLVVLAAASVTSVYFIMSEHKRGTTIGKRIFGLQVLSLDGKSLSLGQCVLRDVLRLVDCMLIVPGLVAMAGNSQKRRLGDLVAGTIVVHSPKKEAERDFLYVRQEDYLALVERLRPEPVDEATGRFYLRFAYPTFIAGGPVSPTADELQRLRETIQRHLPQGPESGVAMPDLERFFAEYCHQSLIAQKRRSP